MCTTLDIDPKLIEAAVRITCEESKSEAAVKAVGEYLKSVQINELRIVAGKIGIDRNLQELKNQDLRGQRRLECFS